MNKNEPYKDFLNRFKLLVRKHPSLIVTTLSNIFTMRLVGNKTHGDLAEIAVSEFINQFMHYFSSVHVGKEKYRAKSKEEDISITNERTQEKFSVSLKAYGHGPLQLSTDKYSRMFKKLEQKEEEVTDEKVIREILNSPAFAGFREVNVLPLIYDEENQRCNILVFNYEKAVKKSARIVKEKPGERNRKHPVYRFYDEEGNYIFEVRYGDATANALQRGLWTDTKKGLNYFDSITGGWIEYSHNQLLVELFSHALVSSKSGHSLALQKIKEDIKLLKHQSKKRT